MYIQKRERERCMELSGPELWTGSLCHVAHYAVNTCKHTLWFHNFCTAWREQGKAKDKDPFPARNKFLLKDKFSMVRFGLARQLQEAFSCSRFFLSLIAFSAACKFLACLRSACCHSGPRRYITGFITLRHLWRVDGPGI